MTPEQLCKEVKKRRERKESYPKIAKALGITAPEARRLALGEKPGKSLADTLDPSAKLKATRERREKLNKIAHEWGFLNWSNYETILIDERDREISCWRNNE
jgi:hypothetical protein